MALTIVHSTQAGGYPWTLCTPMNTNIYSRRGDAAFVPIIASAVSLTILLLQVLWEKHRMASGQEEKPLAGNQGDRLQEPASRDATAPSTLAAQDDNLCRTPRSPSKLYYELARVAAVATSFAISLVPIISQEDSANSSTNYFFQAALALSCVC